MGNSQVHKNTQTSAADSLFGMVLAQSITGIAFGAGVENTFEAAEIGSELYTERHQVSQARNSARTNGNFELGVKNSLAPVFSQTTRPSPAPALVHPDQQPKYLLPPWMLDSGSRRARALQLH